MKSIPAEMLVAACVWVARQQRVRVSWALTAALSRARVCLSPPSKVNGVTQQIHFVDHASRDDLKVLLERLQRVGQTEVRLVSRGSVLAVFGCTQAPAGLMDSIPVVLVMRGFALRDAPAEAIDRTVLGRALLDRLAHMGVIGLTLDLPDVVVAAAWAGVLPPLGGWEPAGVIDAASLADVAQQGIERVAEALPEQPGDALVRKVRSAVWGAEILPGLPAAAAFAAESLGFLKDQEAVRVAKTLTWTRLDTSQGQVLVRSLLG